MSSTLTLLDRLAMAIRSALTSGVETVCRPTSWSPAPRAIGTPPRGGLPDHGQQARESGTPPIATRPTGRFLPGRPSDRSLKATVAAPCEQRPDLGNHGLLALETAQ